MSGDGSVSALGLTWTPEVVREGVAYTITDAGQHVGVLILSGDTPVVDFLFNRVVRQTIGLRRV